MKERESKSRKSAPREPASRDRSAGRSYVFRGRTIEIVPGRADARDRISATGSIQGRLRIDDQEVAYEQTEEGVYSHEMTYMRFGSAEELAEELVRQWGEVPPDRAPTPHHDHEDGPGDHDHGDDGHGPHNHGHHGHGHGGG